MPHFRVAQVQHDGVDLIIVPLTEDFGRKTEEQQNQAIDELQLRAATAGLKGTVTAVWDNGFGRLMFRAPLNWHQFFSSLTWQWLRMHINRDLMWD